MNGGVTKKKAGYLYQADEKDNAISEAERAIGSAGANRDPNASARDANLSGMEQAHTSWTLDRSELLMLKIAVLRRAVHTVCKCCLGYMHASIHPRIHSAVRPQRVIP